MAAPIINTTTSVLGYRQFEAFDYQPYATGTPTLWALSGVPPGMSFNTTTGLLNGTPSTPGVYICRLLAFNADGVSAPIILTIGIESVGFVAPDASIQLTIDMQTRVVTNPSAEAVAIVSDATAPLVSVTQGDGLHLRVKLLKDGYPVALTVTGAKFSLKADETDVVLCASSAFVSAGSGLETTYLIYTAITGTDLADALANVELPQGTHFNGLGEIELTLTHGLGIGPSSVTVTSRQFPVEVIRQIVV